MNIRKEVVPGDFVTSISGRDKNGYYVVMSSCGKFVEICDGDLHKVDKLKKKNIKHIKGADAFDEMLKKKISGREKVSDSEIRKALAVFKQK